MAYINGNVNVLKILDNFPTRNRLVIIALKTTKKLIFLFLSIGLFAMIDKNQKSINYMCCLQFLPSGKNFMNNQMDWKKSRI